MLRFAANLSFLFNEAAFSDRFAAAAAQGFKACEFMFPYDFDAAELRSSLDRNGLKLVLFNAAQGDWNAGERGIAAVPGRESEFDAAISRAADYARMLGNNLVHVMAGLERQGANRTTFVANLKRAADRVASEGLTLIIEPINTRDMPGYFLSRTRQALDILADVGRGNVGLQFDLYHRHIMDGDVEEGLREARDFIQHMQIASPPDRGEPDKGDLDFKHLLCVIDESGYEGYIGLEYKPRNGTVPGLAWAKALGVRFS
ncbi:MAG TPA: TIM barrel protein [Hyphomicrobium sp.]|nr:TIM barrel protein [Hyphomicrobium sp.]